MEDDGFGLLAIDISDGDDEETRPSSASTDKPPTSTMTREELRVARTEQTEEQFQEVRRTWRPKVENGELHRTIALPFSPDAATAKAEIQALLHAVEELYYARRYAEAAAFVDRVLGEVHRDGPSEPGSALDDESRKVLEHYHGLCRRRLEAKG